MHTQPVTENTIDQLLSMAAEHPEPTYDCTFEHYATLLRQYFTIPCFKGWILYNSKNEPIGYVIAANDPDGLMSEITIWDIFIKDSCRGMGNIKTLLQPIKDWKDRENIKRIIWWSKYPGKVWSRLLGREVKEYYTYYKLED